MRIGYETVLMKKALFYDNPSKRRIKEKLVIHSLACRIFNECCRQKLPKKTQSRNVKMLCHIFNSFTVGRVDDFLN